MLGLLTFWRGKLCSWSNYIFGRLLLLLSLLLLTSFIYVLESSCPWNYNVGKCDWRDLPTLSYNWVELRKNLQFHENCKIFCLVLRGLSNFGWFVTSHCGSSGNTPTLDTRVWGFEPWKLQECLLTDQNTYCWFYRGVLAWAGLYHRVARPAVYWKSKANETVSHWIPLFLFVTVPSVKNYFSASSKGTIGIKRCLLI